MFFQHIVAVACPVAAEKEPGLASQVLRIVLFVQKSDAAACSSKVHLKH